MAGTGRKQEMIKMREQLTRKDVERIQAEIDHRKLVVRKEAIEAVKEARAQGDLSENFEYPLSGAYAENGKNYFRGFQSR